MQARIYQTVALDDIRKNFAKGIKKALLHMATGAGKTFIFCDILKGVHAKNKKAIMVAHGAALVEQASQRLFRENVPHGVMQANHWNNNPAALIQICSIDTLYRRKIAPPADILIIDEAHLAVSTSFKWLIDSYKNIYILGVTATPHVKKGLRHIADTVIYPITIKELIEQGWLVPPRYYAPTKINLDKLKIRSGDYALDELSEEVSKAAVYGDIADHWKKHADNRPTVCFAVSIKHSIAIRDFLNAAGIPTEHMEANTSEPERKAILSRLESGQTKIVTNVGILCVGVDLPYLGAIIMARPTKSYCLYIQQLGRGTRPFPNKKDFIVLDHANNVMEHGFIEHERRCLLDGWAKEKLTLQTYTCEQCYAVNPRPFCESCQISLRGQSRDGVKRNEDNADDNLEEMSEALILQVEINAFIKERKLFAKNKGYKRGWVYHQVIGKYGQETADKVMPKRPPPPAHIIEKIKQKRIGRSASTASGANPPSY